MKTRSLMAAGVAAAGAGAVALTALTPATQPELAAAPVASHQVVLTAGDFDLADNLETLWNGVKGSTDFKVKAYQGMAEMIPDILEGLSSGVDLEGFADDPVAGIATVAALPATAVIGVSLLPQLIEHTGNQLGGQDQAVQTVSAKIRDAGGLITGTALQNGYGFQRKLQEEALGRTGESLGRVGNLVGAASTGKVEDRPEAVLKALKDNAGNLIDKQGTRLGALRLAANGNRTAMRNAVDTQLNKLDKSKTVTTKVLKPVRDTLDKTRTAIQKTGDKVRTEVRKALD